MGRRRETRAGDDQVRDEDDHDLLTFAESGIRPRDEISLAEAALRQSPDADRRAALQARLSALTEAFARNTGHAKAKPGEKGFLDYAPPTVGTFYADSRHAARRRILAEFRDDLPDAAVGCSVSMILPA